MLIFAVILFLLAIVLSLLPILEKLFEKKCSFDELKSIRIIIVYILIFVGCFALAYDLAPVKVTKENSESLDVFSYYGTVMTTVGLILTFIETTRSVQNTKAVKDSLIYTVNEYDQQHCLAILGSLLSDIYSSSHTDAYLNFKILRRMLLKSQSYKEAIEEFNNQTVDPNKAPEASGSKETVDPNKAPEASGSKETVDPNKAPEASGSKETVDPNKAPEARGSKETASPNKAPEARGSKETASPNKAPEARGSKETAAPNKVPEARGSKETASPNKVPEARGSKETAAPNKAPEASGSKEKPSVTVLTGTKNILSKLLNKKINDNKEIILPELDDRDDREWTKDYKGTNTIKKRIDKLEARLILLSQKGKFNLESHYKTDLINEIIDLRSILERRSRPYDSK